MYDDYDEWMTRVTILQVSVKTIVGYNFAIAKHSYVSCEKFVLWLHSHGYLRV
jgi:hypothetical protein